MPKTDQSARFCAPLAARLGFWSGVASAVAAVAFVVGVVVGNFLTPQAPWTGDIGAFAAAYREVPGVIGEVFSLLIIPGFTALIAAIASVTPAERRPLAFIAVMLTAAYVALVGANDFIQITTVRLNLVDGQTDGLLLWVKENELSFFYPLEALGYSLQTLAACAAGWTFTGAGLERWVRWSFTLTALAGIVGLAAAFLGLSFLHPVMVFGNAVWLVAFTVGAAASALLFRRLGRPADAS